MFKAVVDAGGFSQASEVVYKSQSSIHSAVSKLEDSLGVTLFTIEGRQTVLTEEGRLLLRRAEFLLDEIGRVETVAESLSRGVETQLRLAIDGAFPQCQIFQVLESVSQKFPQLRFDIFDTLLSGTNELMSQGMADIGLSPFPLDNCLHEEICSIDFIAVAHRDHPLHKLPQPLGVEHLKQYRQIIVRDSATAASANAGWHGAEQRWTVSHIRASIELVENNLGFAWLPQPSIQTQMEAGMIKPLNLQQGAVRSCSFYMNTQDSDGFGPSAKAVMQGLRQLSDNKV